MTIIDDIKLGFESLDFQKKTIDSALLNIKKWYEDETLQAYKPYIGFLAENRQWETLLDSFYRMIPFGTGGRRGPVGAGPNRINPHTITLSVEGHCRYLREYQKHQGDISVVIAYDVRIFKDLRGNYPGIVGPLENMTSKSLARQCAEIYAASGVKSYLIDTGDLTPETENYISTPELSFLVRELGACGGLNVSASHNHPDDNGSKFYNIEGAQEVPPHDERMLEFVEQVDTVSAMTFETAVAAGWIAEVPKSLHQRYLDVNKALCPTESRGVKIAYTPLSGTGVTSVGEALNQLGFDVVLVESQASYDGTFENVKFRIGNPEVPQTLDLLELTAQNNGCFIGLATDPDADRLGLIAREEDGTYRFFTGNELGIIILQSIISFRTASKGLPEHPIFINTIVTTSLQREIARRNGCQVVGNLAVGFKYMGEVLGNLEKYGEHPHGGNPSANDYAKGSVDDFIFTTEEALGFLLSGAIRDKDACGAAVHLCGLAQEIHNEGRYLSDYLYDIYRAYGYCQNDQRSLVMEGIAGKTKISRIQENLRTKPPKTIAGYVVSGLTDFQSQGGPIVSKTDQMSRDILIFALKGKGKEKIRVIIRPSGTEPKTKVYVEVSSGTGLGKKLDQLSDQELASLTKQHLMETIVQTDREAARIGDEFIRYALSKEVLGEEIGVIPPQLFSIPDIVPVDRKIAFCNEFMPELAARIQGGEDTGTIEQWFGARLSRFGKDFKVLFSSAAEEWCISHLGSSDEATLTIRSLFI